MKLKVSDIPRDILSEKTSSTNRLDQENITSVQNILKLNVHFKD